MPVRQKIILLCLVSLGLLVIVATIVRLIQGLALGPSSDIPCKSNLPLLHLPPISTHIIAGDSYDVTTWSAVAVNVGLFCASAPTIRPLIRQLIPRRIMKSQSYLTDLTTQSDSYGGGTIESRARGQGFELHSHSDQSAEHV